MLALAGLSTLAATGCGGSGSGGGDGGASAARGDDEPVTTVNNTTTVEVVRSAAGDDSFDPARIYERDAPGVVTVFSVLPGESGLSLIHI